MNTKLTLSMDKKVIDLAKKNLQNKEQSLSSLVENYFKILIASKAKRVTTPIVEELTGVASLGDNDVKEIITDYLLEKYR